MDGTNEPRKTQDPLINTWRSSGSDRQAERVNDPSNERCAEAGHRDHHSTLLAEKRSRTAEHIPMLEQERPYGSLRYESESKSKRLLTVENMRREPTQVT